MTFTEVFAAALQSVRILLQNEQMATVTEDGNFLTVGRFNARDEAMAENVAWLLEQDPDAKIILWAHNAHLQATEWNFRGLEYTPMGVHLREMYGEEMVALGFDFYEGAFNAYEYDSATGNYNGLKSFQTGPLPEDSYEARFYETGLSRFFMDLRNLPADSSTRDWFSTPHWLRFVGAEYDPNSAPEAYAYPVRLAEAFDVIIYFEETTPSVLLP